MAGCNSGVHCGTSYIWSIHAVWEERGIYQVSLLVEPESWSGRRRGGVNRKYNSVLIQFVRGSSLVVIIKGEALVHISWYPNPFPDRHKENKTTTTITIWMNVQVHEINRCISNCAWKFYIPFLVLDIPSHVWVGFWWVASSPNLPVVTSMVVLQPNRFLKEDSTTP